jgi:hypothetical protein
MARLERAKQAPCDSTTCRHSLVNVERILGLYFCDAAGAQHLPAELHLKTPCTRASAKLTRALTKEDAWNWRAIIAGSYE